MCLTQNISRAVIVLGLMIGNASPAMAINTYTGDDGDLVEVITDKHTYYRSEPIDVMVKYSNFSDEIQGLGMMNLDVRVIVYRVGAARGEQPAFYGPLTIINPNFVGNGVVEPHSAVVPLITTIPAYRLSSGLYEVILIYNVRSLGSPPQSLLQAAPTTVIRVHGCPIITRIASAGLDLDPFALAPEFSDRLGEVAFFRRP